MRVREREWLDSRFENRFLYRGVTASLTIHSHGNVLSGRIWEDTSIDGPLTAGIPSSASYLSAN